MVVLAGIAFVAGMVTAISPCVLPVLPIVFAGSAGGGARRPYAIVAGLVLSFTLFTLVATAILAALGLPADLLRNIAIGVVMAVGLSLVVPRLGALLERPFRALGRRRPGDVGGGFLLGVSLGLLFTPCAGPIIAAVAALMALEIDTQLQTKVPGYTRALQGLEESAAAETRIDDLTGRESRVAAAPDAGLRDFGEAPELAGIQLWLNSEPLTLAALRGKVVLVDFWTYSCVNCLRTLPFLERWDGAYRDDGLVVVGVHTPEFAFEREPANVRQAVRDLGIRYPVALDPDFATWNAWGNRYWPAKYLIDRRGHVRFAHFGEGEYEQTEAAIRALLAEPGLPQPVSGSVADETPTAPQTPETYLGYARLDRLVGTPITIDAPARYRIPAFLPDHAFALGGVWSIERERAVAGRNATLRLRFLAGRAFLVLGARARGGSVSVSVDGGPVRTIPIAEHRLYELARTSDPSVFHDLELRFTPGVEAYAFTFGGA